MTNLSHVSKMSSHELTLALRETCGLIQRLLRCSSDYFIPISNAIKGKEETYFRTDSLLWKDILHYIQFHDIIRQRLEHVEELLHSLMSELEREEATAHLDSTLYLSIMPKLLKLNNAQLVAINNEFQMSTHSMELILKKAEGMEDLKKVDKAALTDLFGSISNEVTSNLNLLAAQLNYGPESNISLLHIENLFTMESERKLFYSVFQLSVEKTDVTDNDIIELF